MMIKCLIFFNFSNILRDQKGGRFQFSKFWGEKNWKSPKFSLIGYFCIVASPIHYFLKFRFLSVWGFGWGGQRLDPIMEAEGVMMGRWKKSSPSSHWVAFVPRFWVWNFCMGTQASEFNFPNRGKRALGGWLGGGSPFILRCFMRFKVFTLQAKSLDLLIF